MACRSWCLDVKVVVLVTVQDVVVVDVVQNVRVDVAVVLVTVHVVVVVVEVRGVMLVMAVVVVTM